MCDLTMLPFWINVNNSVSTSLKTTRIVNVHTAPSSEHQTWSFADLRDPNELLNKIIRQENHEMNCLCFSASLFFFHKWHQYKVYKHVELMINHLFNLLRKILIFQSFAYSIKKRFVVGFFFCSFGCRSHKHPLSIKRLA